MLLLLFKAGEQRFGLDTAEVIEVAPVLSCLKLPHAPVYVSGLANYRGATVPVIDVSALLTGTPAPLLMSTRLLLVRYRGHVLGLLAERAVETTSCRESDLQPLPVGVKEAPYLGPVLVDHAGMIQKISVAELLSEAVRDMLFPAEEPA